MSFEDKTWWDVSKPWKHSFRVVCRNRVKLFHHPCLTEPLLLGQSVDSTVLLRFKSRGDTFVLIIVSKVDSNCPSVRPMCSSRWELNMNRIGWTDEEWCLWWYIDTYERFSWDLWLSRGGLSLKWWLNSIHTPVFVPWGWSGELQVCSFITYEFNRNAHMYWSTVSHPLSVGSASDMNVSLRKRSAKTSLDWESWRYGQC